MGAERSLSCAVLVASAGLLASCGGTAQRAGQDTPTPNTGLNALATESDLKLASSIKAQQGPISEAERTDLVAQAVADLKAYQERNPSAGLSSLTGAAAPTDLTSILGETAAEPAPAPAPVGEAEPAPDVLAQADQAWATTVPAPTPTTTPAPTTTGRPQLAHTEPEDPLADLATRMARLLREPPPGSERLSDVAALAAIESVKPGVLATIESPTNALGPRLAPADLRALIDSRERLLANPTEANRTLLKSLAKIAPAGGVRVSRAVLCRRVEGFGRYEPLTTDTFVAGRPIRAIVYTELDGFMARAARSGDPVQNGVPMAEQVSVELTQSLTLFHDSDGLQAWHKPAQRVVETTRAARRDFYLIHTIELPANLTIGKYRLKVTVTDATSGASDEVTMPITIVASPAPRGSR